MSGAFFMCCYSLKSRPHTTLGSPNDTWQGVSHIIGTQ